MIEEFAVRFEILRQIHTGCFLPGALSKRACMYLVEIDFLQLIRLDILSTSIHVG